jgi:hypothetical protein
MHLLYIPKNGTEEAPYNSNHSTTHYLKVFWKYNTKRTFKNSHGMRAVKTNYLKVRWYWKINTTFTNSHNVWEIQSILLESIQVVKDKHNTLNHTLWGYNT